MITSGYYLYQRSLPLSPTVHCDHYLAYQQRTAWWPKTTKSLYPSFPTISTQCNYELTPIQKSWFVLQGYTSFTQNLITSNRPQQLQQPQSPSNSLVNSTNTPVKAEDLSTLFTGFTKSLIEAIQSTQHRGQPHTSHSHDGKLECNYCGEEHFIHNCPMYPMTLP